MAFMWNETQIANNSSLNKESLFKGIKGEITKGEFLVNNDVLVSESFEHLDNIVKNVTGHIINHPIRSDHIIAIDEVFKAGSTVNEVRSDGILYRLSYSENDDQYLRQGSIYIMSKSIKLAENGTPGNVGWINTDLGALFISVEKEEPISGGASLRVDVRPSVIADERVNVSWSGITSDFIPISNDTYYNYRLDISAKDVDQLHSIVHYYDSNKTGVKEDILSGGEDGTFKKEFKNTFLSPIEAKYVKLELWLRASIGKPSSYLVDNIRISEN